MFAVFVQLESAFSSQMRTYATTYANSRSISLYYEFFHASAATTMLRKHTWRLPRPSRRPLAPTRLPVTPTSPPPPPTPSLSTSKFSGCKIVRWSHTTGRCTFNKSDVQYCNENSLNRIRKFFRKTYVCALYLLLKRALHASMILRTPRFM
jgi:hypothetical protein